MGGFSELPVVRKDPADLCVTPNLLDYATERNEFSWEAAESWLDGLPGDGFNIAYEAVDRHVKSGRGEHVALRCLDKAGAVTDVTYAHLQAETNAFANALRSLGIAPGQRVFSLVGRVPALYTAVLGTLKARSVFAPLFSAFGPEPVKQRVVIGGGVAMVTTTALYRKKIAPVRDEMPTLQHVILLDDGDADDIPGAIRFDELMAWQSREFVVEPTEREEMALLHFTSGTTGTPKAAVHVHGAVVAHYATGHFALDLHANDIYGCTADPGWVTGTSYGSGIVTLAPALMSTTAKL